MLVRVVVLEILLTIFKAAVVASTKVEMTVIIVGIFGSREGRVGRAEVKRVNGRIFDVGNVKLVDLGPWSNTNQYFSSYKYKYKKLVRTHTKGCSHLSYLACCIKVL